MAVAGSLSLADPVRAATADSAALVDSGLAAAEAAGFRELEPEARVAALRDLGALPPDTDLRAVIADLGLDLPTIDPTKLSAEDMVKEVQRVVKALLGYGARLPKELMLYVKNMVFLDGAIARLAPDLDLLAEITQISMYFAQRHGERIATELGIDANAVEFDFDGVKAGFGLEPDVERLTYRELQERRRLIQKRMRSHVERPR